MQTKIPSRTTRARLALVAAAVTLLIIVVALTTWPTNDATAQGNVPDKPARPTAGTVSHDSASISWTDPGDSSITGYQILRRNRDTDDAGAFTVIENDTGNANTSYTDDTVEPSTRYAYRVKARNANGLSSRSPSLRLETPAEPTPTPSPTPAPTPEPTQAPTPEPTPEKDSSDGQQQDRQGRSHTSQPQNLQVTATSYEMVTLQWDEAPHGTTNVKIERTGGSYSDQSAIYSVGTVSTTSLLEPDTSYTFTISFGTSNNHFGPSSSITVRTLAIPAPTNVTSSNPFTYGNTTGARFDWDNPSDTEGLKLSIAFYDENMANESNLEESDDILGRQRSGLYPDTTYHFAVWYRTVDQNGNFHHGPKAYLRFTTPKLPEFSISDAITEEGRSITFTITLTEFARREGSASVSRSFLTTSGTSKAQPDDFPNELNTGALNFSRGTRSRTTAVQTTDDSLYEGDETFNAILYHPMSATIGRATATGTIIDNDPPPRLGITAFTGTEGGQNNGTEPVQGQDFNNVVFRLDLGQAAAIDITLDVDAEDLTATKNQDYQLPVTTVTIPEGETRAYFKVTVIDDSLFDGGRLESFDLVLSNPDPPIFTGEVRTTGYIRDNDPAPAGIDYVDDTVDTTGVIAVGESWLNENPVNGSIEEDYDYDWYRTELQGGHCYQIEVRGQGHTDSGDAQGLTLPDPVLRGVYTQYGNYIDQTQNDDGGAHLAALKTVKIDADSIVYISVMSGQPEERGTFDLSLIDLGTAPLTCTNIDPSVTDAWASTETDAPETVSEPVGEDLPEDTSTIGYVRPNGDPATGNLGTHEDVDYYKVPLIAGFRYTIHLKGDEPSDYGGTLSNTVLFLLGPTGENDDDNILGSDDDSGAGNNAKLRIRVNETDTYFVVASQNGNITGTYTLVVTRR